MINLGRSKFQQTESQTFVKGGMEMTGECWLFQQVPSDLEGSKKNLTFSFREYQNGR